MQFPSTSSVQPGKPSHHSLLGSYLHHRQGKASPFLATFHTSHLSMPPLSSLSLLFSLVLASSTAWQRARA
eukprot:746277-Hanusia_phi.AAC.4